MRSPIIIVIVGFFLFLLASPPCSSFDLPGFRGIKPSPRSLSPPTEESTRLRVKEKLLSVSGEDFNVYTSSGSIAFTVVGSNKVPFGVGGLVLDKLVVRDSSTSFVVSVERRLVSPNLCYDLYDEGGKFVGKIERNPFQPMRKEYCFCYGNDVYYKALGNFIERRYTFKDNNKNVVATVTRPLVELSEKMDEYEVKVEKGVDAAAVVGCVCVIDEDHDEEVQRRREEKKM